MTDIASRQNARHGRPHTQVCSHLTVLVERYETVQELRIRLQTDEEKDAGCV